MNREDRWQHLVNVSFTLSEEVAGQGADHSKAKALLEEVLEVFPTSIDPVEDFEGYAVRRMALALRDALD